MGHLPHAGVIAEGEFMGYFSVYTPQAGMGSGRIFSSKDWASTEFPFLSFSHKLRVNAKEYVMNITALAVIFLLRILFPLSILLALGEWVRGRDTRYRWKGR